MASAQSVAIFEKKLKDYSYELDELADEYAANDDGDIELRDVHTFIMDAVKLVKIEIETSNMMVDFELSTFVKEFVSYLKQNKKLQSLNALIKPQEILQFFNQFLKRNAQKISVIDLIQTQKKQLPILQQQQNISPPSKEQPQNPQQKQQPQQVPQKVNNALAPPIQQQQKPPQNSTGESPGDEEGSEYEEIEEEFEEEVEEEPEEDIDFGNVDDLMDQGAKAVAKAKGQKAVEEGVDQKAAKSHKKKKEVEEDGSAQKTKKEGPPKQGKKGKKENEAEEEKKVNEKHKIVHHDKKKPKQNEDEKQEEQGAIDEKKRKQLLFDDKVETESQKKWKQDKHPKKKLPEIILPQETEEDKNLFNGLGGDSPLKHVELPDSPPPMHKVKANPHPVGLSNEGENKQSNLLQVAVEGLKNKQTMSGGGKGGNENQQSLLNMDKYLLESQESYKSPGLLDEVPDYIRQLSSIKVKDLKDPQIQDAILQLQQKAAANRADPNYDERMVLDNQISDPDHILKPQPKPPVPTQGNVKKENEQAEPEKAAESKPPIPSQQFVLTPLRNPSSDSLKEEKKHSGFKNQKPKGSKQEENKIEVPVENSKIQIQPPPPKKIVKINKVKREFGKVEPIRMEKREASSWYATVKVPTVKAAYDAITMSKNTQEERIISLPVVIEQPPQLDEMSKPKPKQEAKKDIKLEESKKLSQERPQPKSIHLPQTKAFYEKLPLQNRVVHQREQWFATLRVKRVKPLFERIVMEKVHQIEKAITILPASKEGDMKQAEQSDTSKKVTEALKPQQQKPVNLVPKEKPNNKVEPKVGQLEEEKKKTIPVKQQPKLQVSPNLSQANPEQLKPQNKVQVESSNVQKKSSPQRNEKEAAINEPKKGPSTMNLEEIRLDAQKKYKREQEAIGSNDKDSKPLIQLEMQQRPPQIIQQNSQPKPKALPKKLTETVLFQEEVKFTDQLRQPPKIVQKRKLPEPKQKETDLEIDIEQRLKQMKPIQTERPQRPKEIITQLPQTEFKEQPPAILPASIAQQQLPLLKLPKQEDRGNHSDTSPERKNKLVSINPRQKLVKAIQLYDMMISRMDSESEAKEKLLQAAADLRDQLKAMDNLSIHQDELGLEMLAPSIQGPAQQRNGTELRTQAPPPKVELQRNKMPAIKSVSPPKKQDNDLPLKDIFEESFYAAKNIKRIGRKPSPLIENPNSPRKLPLDKDPINDDKKQLQQENMQPSVQYDENARKTIEQLKEIFSHYSKVNLNLKTEFTFEDIKEEQGMLNMNKVVAFLKDFEIQMPSQKVAELFKKLAHQSKVMQFDQFKDFMEQLYLRQFDAHREKIKRKIMSINFKLKKGSSGAEGEGPKLSKEEMKPLLTEKQNLKKQLQEMTTKCIDINQIYKQIREDLKLEDQTLYHSKMRGYIPEYEKLPKISKLPTSKVASPKRIHEEITAAASGVPKIPEFLQLQEMLRKNQEQETQMREKLREQSRKERKLIAQNSSLMQQSQIIPPGMTLESIKQRQGSKLQQKALLDLIDIHPEESVRSKTKLKHRMISKEYSTNGGSPIHNKGEDSMKLPELNIKLNTNRSSVLSKYPTTVAPSPTIRSTKLSMQI